jgi:hypothetical protein
VSRLKRQPDQTLAQMCAELPTQCDVGTKKNSKGFKESWIGYRAHMDVADGQIPVSFILTSASLHDSQAAIPLMTMTRAFTNTARRLAMAPGFAPVTKKRRKAAKIATMNTCW